MELQASHHFVPVAIETSNVFWCEALSFVRDLGHHLQGKTGDPQSHHHLRLRLAVAVQRGNAASQLLGTGQLIRTTPVCTPHMITHMCTCTQA